MQHGDQDEVGDEAGPAPNHDVGEPAGGSTHAGPLARPVRPGQTPRQGVDPAPPAHLRQVRLEGRVEQRARQAEQEHEQGGQAKAAGDVGRRQRDVERSGQHEGQRRRPGVLEGEHHQIAVLAFGREHATGHRVEDDPGRVPDSGDRPDEVEPTVRADREQLEMVVGARDRRSARAVHGDDRLATFRQEGDGDRVDRPTGVHGRVHRALEHGLEVARGVDPEGEQAILAVLHEVRDARARIDRDPDRDARPDRWAPDGDRRRPAVYRRHRPVAAVDRRRCPAAGDPQPPGPRIDGQGARPDTRGDPTELPEAAVRRPLEDNDDARAGERDEQAPARRVVGEAAGRRVKVEGGADDRARQAASDDGDRAVERRSDEDLAVGPVDGDVARTPADLHGPGHERGGIGTARVHDRQQIAAGLADVDPTERSRGVDRDGAGQRPDRRPADDRGVGRYLGGLVRVGDLLPGIVGQVAARATGAAAPACATQARIAARDALTMARRCSGTVRSLRSGRGPKRHPTPSGRPGRRALLASATHPHRSPRERDPHEPERCRARRRRAGHDRVARRSAAASSTRGEIYGGINAVWDYGPLGVELKNNVKRAWWRAMVQDRDDIVGLDAGILMHPQVWVTSGHVGIVQRPARRVRHVPPALSPGRAARAPST